MAQKHSPRSRWPVIACALVAALLVASIAMTINAITKGDSRPPDRSGGIAATKAPTNPSEPGQAPDARGIHEDVLKAEVARLRAVPKPSPESSLPRITGDATTQPDLYAAAFVERLLTQNFGKSRNAWMSWVQAESATTDDPLVMGLVPRELRDRFAVFSVTDTADGPSPIPSVGEWVSLRGQAGRTTVRIQRVTEPMAWTNAVEAGRITDPGVTARVVSAEVTRHTVVDGQPRVARYSVEISLQLEGPPTRAAWGFVGVITYTSIPMGAS